MNTASAKQCTYNCVATDRATGPGLFPLGKKPRLDPAGEWSSNWVDPGDYLLEGEKFGLAAPAEPAIKRERLVWTAAAWALAQEALEMGAELGGNVDAFRCSGLQLRWYLSTASSRAASPTGSFGHLTLR